MEFSSLQVCMDSSDWLQGTMSEDGGFDSSSSPTSHDMLTCSRPLIERRLRPPRDQALKCPRCESTHTKFCYYNNYSLSQPRYFCKTCRRYWTKGGTLRNIPVGGGCRKNKKPTTTNGGGGGGGGGGGSNSKKPSSSSVQSLSSNDHLHDQHNPMSLLLQNSIGLSPSMMPSGNNNPTELQLSFPHHDQVTFSHFSNLIDVHGGLGGDIGFMESKYNAMLENNHNNTNNNNNGNSCSNNPSRPIDFMENYKLDALVGHDGIRGRDFLGNGAGTTSVGGGFGNIMGGINGVDPLSSTSHGHGLSGCGDYSGFCSPFGLASMDHGNNNTTAGGNGAFLDQRLMLPFDGNDHREMPNSIDVKPNATKLLSLQWQDQHQGCSDDRHNNHINGSTSASKGSFGYNNVGGLSSWSGTGMISGYGPSTTNPLV